MARVDGWIRDTKGRWEQHWLYVTSRGDVDVYLRRE